MFRNERESRRGKIDGRYLAKVIGGILAIILSGLTGITISGNIDMAHLDGIYKPHDNVSYTD